MAKKAQVQKQVQTFNCPVCGSQSQGYDLEGCVNPGCATNKSSEQSEAPDGEKEE